MKPMHAGQALPPALRQVDQIRHDRAARSRHAGLVLLRTIGGALGEPISQSVELAFGAPKSPAAGKRWCISDGPSDLKRPSIWPIA